jgi:ketosteroid isomerase-like protein
MLRDTGRVTSEENVELVRSALNALRRDDPHGVARGFRADAVWHNTAAFPGQRTCVGPEEILGFWRALIASFDEGGTSVEIQRAIGGENSVALAVRSHGRGRTSRVPVDVRWGVAFQVRDGMIDRVDVHGDWTKALEAAGLSE